MCGCSKPRPAQNNYPVVTTINIKSVQGSTVAQIQGQVALYLSQKQFNPDTKYNIIVDGNGPMTKAEIEALLI